MRTKIIVTAVVAAIATWAPWSLARETVALPYLFGVAPGDSVGQATGIDTTGGGLLTINPNININTLNDVGGGITSSANNTASIMFSGGSTVTGFTGTSLIRFFDITAGANATTTNFNGNVFTTTFNILGTGIVNFNGSVNPAIVAVSTIFQGDGFINLGANQQLNSAITTLTAGTGTLTLNGGSSVIGAIGGASGIRQINVVGGNASITGAVQAAGFSLGTNTLSIVGALTTNAGATIATTLASNTVFGNIAPTGASNINAAGITVTPTVTGVLTTGTNFKIVNGLAGALGTTVNVVNNNPRYTFAGVPTTTGDVNILLTTVVPLAAIVVAPQAAAVAPILDVIAAPGTDLLVIQNAIAALTTAASINNALSQLAPSNANLAAPWVSGQATRLFEDVWMSRVDEVFACESNRAYRSVNMDECKGSQQRSNWWAKGLGSVGRQNDVDSINGYHSNAVGLMIGYDVPVSNNMRVGLGAGYVNSSLNENNSDSRTKIDSYQATGYFNYTPGSLFVQGALTAGVDQYDSSRRIVFTGVDRTASSDFTGQQYTGLVTTGAYFHLNQVTITPTVSLQASHIHVGSYTETGAGDVNLRIDRQNYNFVQSGLGLKAERIIQSGNGTYSPDIHAKWLHDFNDTTMEQNATFTGGGASFREFGVNRDRDLYNVGAGFTFLSCNCDKNLWTVKGLYDYKWNESSYSSHQLSLTAGMKF